MKIGLLRTHVAALLAACSLAILVASPLIAFPYAAGKEYGGIDIAHISDEYIYLVRAKDALEGHNLGQPVLAVGKDVPDATFSFVEPALVAPMRLLGLSDEVNIVTYFNVINVLGVFLTALLMYAFMFRLSGNRLAAVAATVFAIGGYTITEAHTLFYQGFNIYGRSMFPFASSVPFFAFLYSLHEALVAGKGRKYIVAAGGFLGLMCYIYFFAWTYSFALIGALALIYLARRDWDALRTVVAVGVIGVVVGSLNLISLFVTMSGPIFSQLSFFYLSVQSHMPVMSNAGAVTAILLTILLWRKGWERNTALVAGIITAGWIALNQQIITGRTLQYGHYFWYFVSPLSIMLASYLAWRLFPERWKKWFAIFLIALGFVTLAGQQYRSFRGDFASKMAEQDHAPLMRALRALPYGVVLTNAHGDYQPMLVTIYTDHDLYWNGGATPYIFSIDHLKEAFLTHLYLNRDARKNPIAFLEAALSRHDSGEYMNLYLDLEGFYSGYDYREYQRRYDNNDPTLIPVRTRLLAELDSRYKEDFSSPQKLSALFAAEHVRYVIWDKSTDPEWDLSVFAGLTQVVQSGPYVLYKIGD